MLYNMGLLSCETVKSMSNKYIRMSDTSTKQGLTQSLLKTSANNCQTNLVIRDIEKTMQEKSIFGHTDSIVNGIEPKSLK